MQNLRRSFLAAILSLVSVLLLGRTASAQSGNYQLASGQVSNPISADPGGTNVQVTPSSGTVTVIITWADGKQQAFTASRDRPLNHTRYTQEHEGVQVRNIVIAYPTQPPGTHDAVGRYRIQ